MLNAAGTAAIGSIKWKQRWLGSQGWATGMAASRDGLWSMVWFDVSPFFARRLSIDEPFMPLLVPGKVPNRMLGYQDNGDVVPGSTAGGWGGGFGGPDAQVCYLAYGDAVYVSSNFTTDRTFAITALTNKGVDSNVQMLTRTWAGKTATDPINRDVYYAHMSRWGFYRTLDRGVTFPKVSWCPDPIAVSSVWDPDCRWGIIAVDESGPNTSTNVRKARGAVCPNGGGVWLTTDGFDTGTNISTSSGPGKIKSVCAMKWIGGKLYVAVVNEVGLSYDQTTSAATGGAGNTAAGSFDNVRVYDPATSTWSIVNHGMENKPTLGWVQAIVPDPTNSSSFFLWTVASEVARFNGSTWTYTGFGQGALQPANGLIVHSFLRTASTDRPNVASRYRNGANCYALSDPIIVPHPTTGLADALMVAPTGLGPLATRLADWPTQNYVAGDAPLNPAKAPLWKEITAGAEAKVGQVPLWLGDRLWNGGQDISISLAENGSRGQGAAVYTFPPTGGLSDADEIARGHVPNFGVVYRQRSGGNHVMGISYTTDNVEWHIAPNQPPSYDGILNPYSPATIACGANYSCVSMPGWCFGSQTPGLVPVVWADIRSSTPQPITFKKEDGTIVPGLFSQNDSFSGFHGAFFSNPSKKVAIDPANPSRYYFWNIGGCVSGGDWVSDPADVGGIYMMDVNGANPTTATRVYSAKAATGFGNPQRASNFGVFDTAMLIAGDYMFLANNYLFAGPAQTGNRGVVLNIRTWERRFLTTGPGNAMTYCLGDPLYGTMPCLWTLAWSADGSAFGAWYSHDWYMPTQTWQGPFNADMPTGGWPARMDAHLAVGNEPRHFGRLGVSIRTRGLAEGSFQLG